MTLDPRQAARDAVRRVWAGNTPLDTLADAAVDAYLSTAPSGQAPLEGVKPLEWKERSGAFYADTAFGEACIDEDGDGFYVIEQGRKHSDFASVEAAQTFVQKNHNRWVGDWLLPASAEPVACDHDWGKTHEDHCMFVCSKCREAFTGNVIDKKPEGWTGKYQPLYASPPAGGAVEAGTYSHPYEDWRKAINFAIETDEPQAFLKCWSHGEWDVLDREWPEWGALFPASPREGS